MSFFFIGLAALAVAFYGLLWLSGDKDIPAWVPTLFALNWLLCEMQLYALRNP